MQDADDERRMQILRGQYVEPPPSQGGKAADEPRRDRPDGLGRERKRRRIAGEDDTDREIRFAREDRAMLPAKAETPVTRKKNSDAPLTDIAGHINLFPSENKSHKDFKNAEAEAEKAKKKKEFEDQYTMRLSNAAGFKQAIDQRPWYETTESAKTVKDVSDASAKDVWGNEDPRRKERARERMVADDPLAMMRNGAAGVREAEKQRARWIEEKAQEIQAIEEDHHRSREKRRRRHNVVEDRIYDGGDTNRSGKRHGHHSNRIERKHHHSHRHHIHGRDRER